MITARITKLLESCRGGQPAFAPTVFYNENWLLRVVLDWFSEHGGDRDPMSPRPGARWFSEAWLPSAFLPRHRGDALAESRTHADGVVGHFTIGDPGTAGLALSPDASQLVVVEAKLLNRFSAGVRNAPFYDQAARTVACMAEVLRRANRDADDLADLSFLTVAPRSRIDDGVFVRDCSPESIRRKVLRRVEEYGGLHDAWYRDWFLPTWRRVDVRCLAWEDAIEAIAFHDAEAGQLLDSYYGECLRCNRPQALAAFPGRRTRGPRPGATG